MKVNTDGRIYLTGDNLKSTLQKVLDKAVVELSYSTQGDSDNRIYYVQEDKVNAFIHEAYAKQLKNNPKQEKEELLWKVKGLSNTNFDTKISGATMTEKVKFFGIPLKEVQKELSRDEYVTHGAETDFFEIFERKIHTDLMKLVNDDILTDPEKFDQMVEKVKKMGEVSWKKEQNNRSWLSKTFGDNPPEGIQLDSILFKRGVYELVQKSNKEGTDLATELRKLYENNTENTELTSEQKQAVQTLQNGLKGLENVPALKEAFANLDQSSLRFGVMLSGLEYGDVNVPEDKRELISETSQLATEFLHSQTVETWEGLNETSRFTTTKLQNLSSSQSFEDWKMPNRTTENVGNQIVTKTYYEREGELVTVATYEDTTTINSERKGERTTVTTYEDTKTTKKVYKVTKYKKESPKQKLEFTIDATQNIFSVEAMPGLNLSAKAGLGGVINNLSEKGYVSLGLNAKGQLTPDLQMQLGVGERFRNGEFTSSLSAKVNQKVTENLKIFAGVNSSTLDAWSELLSLDRMTAKTGVEYDFDKWTLATSVMI